MILNGKTDIGKRRKNNQDSFVIRLWEDIGCALGVVCDGMGGANGGNIASALACEHFVAAVEAFVTSDKVRDGAAFFRLYSSVPSFRISRYLLNAYVLFLLLSGSQSAKIPS